MKIEDIKVGEVYQFTNLTAPGSPQYPDGEVRVERTKPWLKEAGLYYFEVSYTDEKLASEYARSWECQLRELSEITPPTAKGSQEPIVISKHCYYTEHEMCLHSEICNCDCHKHDELSPVEYVKKFTYTEFRPHWVGK